MQYKVKVVNQNGSLLQAPASVPVLSVDPPANNSTLVYSSANNKYVVKQMDLDGGSF